MGIDEKYDMKSLLNLQSADFLEIPVLPTTEIETAKSAVEEEKNYLENKRRSAFVEKFLSENTLRQTLTHRIFKFTCIWLAIVLLIVISCGLGLLKLSDTVIITLITTTTANVIGFFVLVIRYLFNPKKST
jgi:hypothetical protein